MRNNKKAQYKGFLFLLTILPTIIISPLDVNAEVAEEIIEEVIEDITVEPTPEPEIPVEPEAPEEPTIPEPELPIEPQPDDNQIPPVSNNNNTVNNEASTEPSINQAIARIPNVESIDLTNRMITGVASPSAMITVFYEHFTLDNIIADSIGNWKATIPEGVNLEDGETLKFEFNSKGVRSSLKKEIESDLPSAKKKKELIQGNRIEHMEDVAEETPDNLKKQTFLGLVSIILVSMLALLTPKVIKFFRFL